MNTTKLSVFPIFFLVLTIILAMKGFELLSLGSHVDGAVIGVYFLFIEMNDRVPEENIPSYGLGFFISSFVTLLITIGMYLRTYMKLKEVHEERMQ